MNSADSTSSLNYKSTEVVEARLKEMLQCVEKKTQSNLDQDELLRSCHALIGGVTTNPRFKHLKLLHLEKVIFPPPTPIERPTTDELKTLLNPWLDLAELAYSNLNGAPLEEEMQTLMGPEYKILRHSTVVETGGVGYFLAANPDEKKLLVGIKGTSTLSEIITDCLATTIPHRCIPNSPFTLDTSTSSKEEEIEIGAHEGILASSIKMCDELKPILNEKLPLGYSVDLVGHSLGAGAASVLAILLRAQYTELHQPDRLHAYCFATPPVVDHRAAELSAPFVTSIANRNDCVTRMAIANVEILVKMLEGFNQKVMKREGINSFWSIAKEIQFGKRMQQLSDEQFAELVEIMFEAQKAVQVDDKDHLYVPGKIVSMYGTLDALPERGQEAAVRVKSAIIQPAHTFLRYFEVNDRIVYDHTLKSYRDGFQDCIENRQSIEKENSSKYRSDICLSNVDFDLLSTCLTQF